MAKPTVLYIIDDDRDDQLFLIEALNDIDPTLVCLTANNGQDALQKLDAHSVPVPSIIFLDLNMPRVNGRQFLLELKKNPRFEFIPIIIYTTSNNQKDIDELKQLGATDYLEKQSDYPALKEKLNSILSTVFIL